MSLPIVTATRYVLPLREGGSLPGVVEGNDLGTYVLKFHGAGQGPKALVAEIIVGELFRRLGLRVPELKLMNLDPAIGKSEPDFEIQELLLRSAGLNLAVDFLPGAFGYDGSSGAPATKEWPASSGWTRTSPTSTARGGTRTCWSGTRTSG